MTVLKRVPMLVAALVIISGMTELGEQLFIQAVPGFVSTAKAVVGRPLTPVSVAGWHLICVRIEGKALSSTKLGGTRALRNTDGSAAGTAA
ncbi:hypothetical protein [Mesorhizobium sp. P5_C1]